MGAGKSTLGPEIATKLGRPFVSVDARIEDGTGMTIAELFAMRGEAAFRELEEQVASEVLARRLPAVVELGGGAVGSERTRRSLAENAFCLALEVSPEEAWIRVAGSGRPLATTEDVFRALYEERRPLYAEVADGSAGDLDGALLAAAGVRVDDGGIERLSELVPGDGPIELVADATVASIHGAVVASALEDRLTTVHEVPAGERAKSVEQAERLWSALRIDRYATLVALGGGSTLDLSGFVAAAYLRGVSWVPVPTTLVAQVDASIGGKTAVDLAAGKNLVGAFHWPARVVVDPELLSTLPDAERENGLAEVVKTGLLAGEAFWELPTAQRVRRCAAYKAGVCLLDPEDRAERAQLNLGHSFAHALEAASGYELPHGRAVALGLVAACRLSGLDEEARLVEELLRPQRVRVNGDVAWAALSRDKKAVAGRVRLVLLEAPGKPRIGVELEDAEVRGALESLIV